MTERNAPTEISDDAPTPDSTPDLLPRSANDGTSDDIGAVRELVLKAHPDVVPELVTGTSVSELLSTIEPAQAAYARLLETVRSSQPHGPAPQRGSASTGSVPAVPAGGSAPVPIDPDRLPAAEKIRRGLQSRSA